MDSDSDWRISCPTIRDKNLHSLNTGKFSDLVFLVGDTKERIQAHKYILVLSSAVFETQFGDRWNHEDEIEIPEVSPKSFRMFLEYLYVDKFSVTEIEAPEVLFLAHKNGRAVFEDIGFLQIGMDTLSSILKSDKLVVEEMVIFHAIMRWAEKKCKEEELDCTVRNKRIVLNDLIPLIRFTLLSPEEFTNEVCVGQHEGILSDAESNSVYKYWNVGSSMRTRLPSLPFNVRKRCSENIYKFDLYEGGHGLVFLTHCRLDSSAGSTTHCEATLRFRSNRKIYLMGIELSHNSTYLAFTHTLPAAAAKPDISASLSKSVTSLDNLIQKKLVGLSVPSSLVRNEFSGVQIEKDVNYFIKLVINDGTGLSSKRLTFPGIKKKLGNPVKVICEEGDVEFKFNIGSTKCHQQDHDDDYWRLDFDPETMIRCICDELIKAIHFTI